MKKLAICALVLGTMLTLSGCGGGSTASESIKKSSSETKNMGTASAPQSSTALDVVSTDFHSANAIVETGAAATKSAEIATGFQSVALNDLKQHALAKAPQIDLGNPSEGDFKKLKEANEVSTAGAGRKAYQIGISRPISGSALTKSAVSPMSWTTLANGNTFGAVGYASTGAKRIRIGLVVTSLPSNATVFAIGSDPSAPAVQFTGAQINQTIAANLLADGDSTAARTFWLPSTQGATGQLAIELPAGASQASVAVSVPTLIHFVQSAPQATVAAENLKSSCPGVTPDVSCSTPLPPAANAVDAYEFTGSNGSGYVCTGTLVADKAASGTPYVVTANHCISSQTEASSVTSYWFYRSSACNSSTVNPSAQVTYGGATLLYTKDYVTANTRNPVGTDTTLLRLNSAPPSGVTYVGWTNNRQGISSSPNLTAIHSPQGAFLRQSTGIVSGMGVVNAADDLLTTNDTTQPLYKVTWNSGITEQGSSGSGLFLDGTTSNPKIIGQLLGGDSSCTAPTLPDFYGRFDLAYQNGMINWLNPGYRMVFRFFNGINGAHFFSANVTERDSVRNTNLALGYEGPVFSVASAPGTGLSPVYRFYNTGNGAHFYTISESERAAVVANAPWYRFEGVAWYARQNANPGAGSIPVYRFYVKSLGTHLYTVSPSERDYIIQNLGYNYNYEGIAYQAWSAS